MALASRLSPRAVLFSRNVANIQRNFSYFRGTKTVPTSFVHTLCIIGGGIAAFASANLLKSRSVQAYDLRKSRPNKDDERLIKLKTRERRFIKFSSVEYNGQLYMTPLDFLDSVVEQEPRPRLKRRMLTKQEIEHFKDITPSRKYGSKTMFRDLREKGIISYTEYLFLLSILTKPISGFRIAFNMFDTDGNQKVDKHEFLVIKKILGGSLRRSVDDKTRAALLPLVSSDQIQYLIEPKTKKKRGNIFMEKIFSGAWRGRRGKAQPEKKKVEDHKDSLVDDEEGLQRRHIVDTTLQIHFFGKKGNQELNYGNFHKFMDDLQTEILEMEFNEFSKGNPCITELDFARILLRYTYLDIEEYDMILDRLLDRMKDESGITFKEFQDFCRFLNNIDDFSIAMRMYTLADRAISKDEMQRAVQICTGYQLTDHLVDTVFAIFDQDGDGQLSYREFIAIMKDRLHRGFKSVSKTEGWDAFKHCIKQELKQAKN